jgi:hypothetical protein
MFVSESFPNPLQLLKHFAKHKKEELLADFESQVLEQLDLLKRSGEKTSRTT